MSPIILYMIPYSQPVRATLLTIKALNLEVELKQVNLLEKQQLSAEFTKINPQHTVPTLVDEDGFVLYDSHAIMEYLVDKYGENDFLLPKDLKKRATVHQLLHFECGTLFPIGILGPIIYHCAKSIPEDKIIKTLEAYGVLEKTLEHRKYVATDAVTIADFSVVSTMTTLDIVVPIDSNKYPNITRWIRRMEELPYYDENKRGLDQIRQIITSKLK